MKGYQMKLMKKILLSTVITLSLTGPCNSMGVGPAAAAAAVPRPDFFATVPDELFEQIIQNTLTQAANDDPTLHQFGDTFIHLKATCHRFRMPGIGEDFLVRTLGNSTIHPNEALFEISKHGQHEWLIPLLIRAGANVNTQDREIKTPLHIAAFNNKLLVVQELIRLGANVNAKDKYGWAPLYYTEDPEVMRLLMAAMIAKTYQRIMQRTGQIMYTVKNLFTGNCDQNS